MIQVDGACVFWAESQLENGTGRATYGGQNSLLQLHNNKMSYPVSYVFLGYWSTEGCDTNRTESEFICTCNHLSFFAVLVVKKKKNSSTSRMPLKVTYNQK